MPRQKKQSNRNTRRMSQSSPDQKHKKKEFEVMETETIGQCLERIETEGYRPVARREKPIFREIVKDGNTTYEPAGKRIIFDVKSVKSER